VTLKRKKAENAKLMEETATHRTERRIGKDNLPTVLHNIIANVANPLQDFFGQLETKTGHLRKISTHQLKYDKSSIYVSL
jgi:hypothetical protein